MTLHKDRSASNQTTQNNGHIVVAKQLSLQLLPHHRDHLYGDGFPTAFIEILIEMGVRSIDETEARSLGFIVKGADGRKQSGSGIYFPFSKRFGQLRLDNPITRANGSVAKYLTPRGKTATAYLPEGCRVVTEGFKDGMAGTLHGRIITGVLAGVTHYRKLPKGSGLTIIFDSDAWSNPNVMFHLIRAGLWVKGKINIIPKIPGKPKAGLCEYFQAGYTDEDYAQLVEGASTPKEQLFKWASNLGSTAVERWRDALKKIFKLAAQLLDEIEQHQLVQILQKVTRFALTALKKWLASAVATVRKLKGDASDEDSLSKDETLYQIALNELYNDSDHPYIYFQKQFWRYGGTHYEKIHNADEMRRIANYCDSYAVKKIRPDGTPVLTYPYADPKYPDRIWKWAAEKLAVNPELVNPPGLNCTDGVLQLEYDPAKKGFNHHLVPHSQDLIYTYPPLVTYEATAIVSSQQCDRLLECLDPASRDIFLKTIGASFDLNFVRQHRGRDVRALFLSGTGSNGKDALREAVSTLFGHQGITDASIGDFHQYDKGRKFTLAKLEGVNISWHSENSDANLIDRIQSLKLAVTGQSLHIERKGVNEYSAKPKCIVLFNVNSPPQLLGAMTAIKSRYAFIKFNKTYATRPGPGELQADARFLYDPAFVRTQVAPWLLKYCLDALDRLMRDGIDYSSTEVVLEEIQEKTDHIYSFCRDTGLLEAPGEVLYAPDVYERLQNWYVDQGFLEIEELPDDRQRKKWYPPTTWGDHLVKGVNQVFPRLIKLFPKAKRERDSTGRYYLTGLAFVSGDGGGSPSHGGAGGSPGHGGAGGSPGTGVPSVVGSPTGTTRRNGSLTPNQVPIDTTASAIAVKNDAMAANSRTASESGLNSNTCYSSEHGLKQSEDGLKMVKPNPGSDSERAEAIHPKIEAKKVNLNFHDPVKKFEIEKNPPKLSQQLQDVQNRELVSVGVHSDCFRTASEDVQNGNDRIQNRVETEAVPESVLRTELQAPQPVVFLLELLARLEADENCIGCTEQLKQLWDRVSAAITEIHQLERQGVFVEYWFDEPDFWERAIPISDRIQQRLESARDNGSNSSNGGTTTPKTPNPKTPAPSPSAVPPTPPTPGTSGSGKQSHSQESTATPVSNQAVVILNPDAAAYLQQLEAIANAPIISVDCETFGENKNDGLHPWNGDIRLIQLCIGDTTYIVDFGSRLEPRRTPSHGQTVEVLKVAIANPNQKIVGHNLHFDLRFLATKLGIRNATNVACTLLGLKTFYGDYGGDSGNAVFQGGYSLENAVKRLLNITLDKTHQTSDWGAPLTPAQIEYAATDAAVTFVLYQALENLYADEQHPLSSQTIREIWSVENRAIAPAIEIELTGMPVDLQLVNQQLSQIEGIKQQLLTQWRSLCPNATYTQRDKLLKFLNDRYQLGLTKLDKASCAEHKTNPLVELRLELTALDALANNLKGFQRAASRDGRVHTIYKTLTGFGRFASGGGNKAPDLPNLQSISAKSNPTIAKYKPPKVREAIRPPAGRGMAVIDLAGAHGRIAADQTRDPVAIAGNNDDSIDNHSKVATYIAKAAGLDWTAEHIGIARKDKNHPDHAVAKLFRDTAKNTYYGFLNGAGAQRIQQQIAANTGKTPELAACSAAIEGCKQLYPKVLSHRYNLMKHLRRTAISVDGQIVAVNQLSDGARILLPLVPSKRHPGELDVPFTQALACIWTRIEATAVKRALPKIMELSKANPQWQLRVTNYVHDEIDIEFDNRFAPEAVTAVNDLIGDEFQAQLKLVKDGRETHWQKLLVESWADK